MEKKYQEVLLLLSDLLSESGKEKEIEILQREIKELESYRKEENKWKQK